MTNQITDVANYFSTTLTSAISDSTNTIPVASIGDLTSPCFIVINPDTPASREVILCDGTFGASSFVTSDRATKGALQGSFSPGVPIAHADGSPVSVTPLAQHIDDLNDRVGAHTHTGGDGGAAITHADLSLLTADDHTLYVRKDGTRAFTGDLSGDLVVSGNLSGTDGTFSGVLSSTSYIRGIDGTAALPAYSFTSDTDTGLFLSTVGVGTAFGGSSAWTFGKTGTTSRMYPNDDSTRYLEFNSSGADWRFHDEGTGLNILTFTNTGVVSTGADLVVNGETRAGDGSAAAPTYSFASEDDMGLFRGAASVMDFAVGGTSIWRMGAGEFASLSTTAIFKANSGTITAAYTFTGDTDTGMFRPSANDLDFIAAGSSSYRVQLNGSGSPSWRPNGTDGTLDLGGPAYRWGTLYSSSGMIDTSDRKQKEDVADVDLGLDFVRSLKPKKYKMKGGKRPHYGLVAQEVKEAVDASPSEDFAGFIDPKFEADDMDGKCPYCPGKKWADKEEAKEECAEWHAEQEEKRNAPLGLRYSEFIAPLVKAVQELSDRIETLETA